MSWIVEAVTAPYEPDEPVGCAVMEDCHLIEVDTADEALDAVLCLRENPTLSIRVIRARDAAMGQKDQPGEAA